MVLLLGYSFYQIGLVIDRDNDVYQSINYGYFPENFSLNMSDIQMKFAFGMAHYKDYEPRDDEDFVEWEVLYRV